MLAVQDLHAWTLTSAQPVLSAHFVVTDDCISDGSAGRVLNPSRTSCHRSTTSVSQHFQLEPVSHAVTS